MLLPYNLARKLVEHDLHSILGQGSGEYWAKIESEFGVPKPGGNKPAIGIVIYGDEGEIFDGCQYMAVSWMSENCPKWKDAKMSRYLIALVPTGSYLMRGQYNVTMQSLFAEVVKSLNLFAHGIQDVLFGAVTSLKGDWKFIVQTLNLKRKPGSDSFCFLCNGTLSLSKPVTDRSPAAVWRTEVPSPPWDRLPEVFGLRHFHLGLVGLDILHCWYLGTGRDLVSSVLVILLRLGFFVGPDVTRLMLYSGSCFIYGKIPFTHHYVSYLSESLQVKTRMINASRLIVSWSHQNLDKSFNRLPKHWMLTKGKLCLKGGKYTHMLGKGWHCDVVLRFLEDFLCQDNVDVDPLIKTTVWSAQTLLGLFLESRHDNGMWMLPGEIHQVQVIGDLFLNSYLRCHAKYRNFCVFKLFNIRPKFHEYEHLLLSTLRQKNPLMGATWLDETWLKEVLRVARRTHRLKTHESTLQRYCAGLVNSRNRLDWTFVSGFVQV